MKIQKNKQEDISSKDLRQDKLLESKPDYDDAIPDFYLSNPLSKEALRFKRETVNKALNQHGFSIAVKDREIWVNNYLIARPHAVGKNMSFFEYLMENPGKVIKRNDLQPFLQEEVHSKKFSKILHDLGFRSEILKTFFPKRGKGSLVFTPRVSQEELARRGVKIDSLVIQLEIAHGKNGSV